MSNTRKQSPMDGPSGLSVHTVDWFFIGEMYLIKNTLYFKLLGSHALRTKIIHCIMHVWSRTL